MVTAVDRIRAAHGGLVARSFFLLEGSGECLYQKIEINAGQV
jgi:hypothetical protein